MFVCNCKMICRNMKVFVLVGCGKSMTSQLAIEYILVYVAGTLALFGNKFQNYSYFATILMFILETICVYCCYQFENDLKNCMESTSVHLKDKIVLNFLRNLSRRTGGLGLWMLLYFALVLRHEDKPCVVLCICFVSLVLMCKLTAVLQVDCAYITDSITLCTAVVSCIVLNIHTDRPWTLCTIVFCLALLSCMVALVLMYSFPESFTLGEALIIAQFMMLFGWRYAHYQTDRSLLAVELEILCSSTVMLTVVILVLIGQKQVHSRPTLFTTLVTGCVLTAVYRVNSALVLHAHNNIVTFVYQYIFLQERAKIRLSLLLLWVLCTLASAVWLVICAGQSTRGHKFTTSLRKYVHFTSSLVTISGLEWQPQLTFTASLIVFCAFVLVESVRCRKIGVVGVWLAENAAQFVDSQDQGHLILTPIYLLVALFLPLWLYPVGNVSNVTLVHYAGIATVGVGDSFASIIGSKFGRKKWAKSRKSVVGTAAACVCMFMFFVIVIGVFGVSRGPLDHCDLQSCCVYLFVICLLLALFETFSCTIDNLSLPLLAIPLLL